MNQELNTLLREHRSNTLRIEQLKGRRSAREIPEHTRSYIWDLGTVNKNIERNIGKLMTDGQVTLARQLLFRYVQPMTMVGVDPVVSSKVVQGDLLWDRDAEGQVQGIVLYLEQENMVDKPSDMPIEEFKRLLREAPAVIRKGDAPSATVQDIRDYEGPIHIQNGQDFNIFSGRITYEAKEGLSGHLVPVIRIDQPEN